MNTYRKLQKRVNEILFPDGIPLEFGVEIDCFCNDIFGYGDFYPEEYFIGGTQLNDRFQDIKVEEYITNEGKIEIRGSIGQHILGFKEMAIDKILGKPVTLQELIRSAREIGHDVTIQNYRGRPQGEEWTIQFFDGESTDTVEFDIDKEIKDQDEEVLESILNLIN